MNESEAGGGVMAASGEAEEGGKGAGRREKFVQAAHAVFLEKGFEAASMADIVRRAGGGSLSTMYDLFGSKDNLFEEVIAARVKVFTSPMELERIEHAPLKEGLTRIGNDLLTRLMETESREMARLMMAQSKKFPKMSAAFQRGTERIRGALTSYLEDRAAAGEIKIKDADKAAMVFFDLLRYRMPMKAILDQDYRPGQEEIRETVRSAIAVFLGGVEAL